MTFTNPAAWWLTTLMVPIIALHVLKAQRTEVVVSSTLEWDSIDRPVAAARPWQRLRWSIPLVLQLLVVALLAAALAGPAWDTGRISAQHVVVMVDTSASMDGTDGSPTRLAAAKDAVRDLLGDLGSGTRVSLIATGAPAHIVASEVPLADVDDRLDQLETSEGGFDAEATGSLAVSLDRPDRSIENVLVSDGGLDASAIRLLPAGTRFVSVGRSDRNLGITNVVVSARGNLLHVQATVSNAGGRTVTAVVRFDVDGRTRDSVSVKVPDHASVETATDVAAGSRVEVLLDGEDVLRLDDHVYAAGPELTKVKVLVVGEADPFLAALVASNPDIEPTTMTPAEFAAAPSPFDGVDMAVFDESAVPPSVPVPYLAIAPPGGTTSVTVDGDVTEPVPTLVRDDVDLLADLDLSGLAIATAQKVSAPAASSLIAAEGAPLLVSGRDGDSPFVYLSMPIAESNLGLLPAFPVLGDRIFDSLGRTDLVGGDLHAGDALDLDASTEAVVTSPTGTETTVRPGTAAPELDRTGFWTIAIEGQGVRTVVVNPDPAESDVAPVAELAIPGVRGGLDGDGEPVTRSIVAWLIAAALLALTTEWWFSRRRRVSRSANGGGPSTCGSPSWPCSWRRCGRRRSSGPPTTSRRSSSSTCRTRWRRAGPRCSACSRTPLPTNPRTRSPAWCWSAPRPASTRRSRPTSRGPRPARSSTGRRPISRQGSASPGRWHRPTTPDASSWCPTVAPPPAAASRPRPPGCSAPASRST